MPLDLGVDEGPEDVGGEGQVRVDQLRLLVQAVQREVIPKLHRLDGVLLLRSRVRPGHGWRTVTDNTPPSSWPRASSPPSVQRHTAQPGSRGADGMEDCQ